MIEAEVHRDGIVIMARTYTNPNLSLQNVIHRLEAYILNEQLHTVAECHIRARFTRLTK